MAADSRKNWFSLTVHHTCTAPTTALPDLRTKQARPTGAIRGVLSMLRLLVDERKARLLRGERSMRRAETFRDDWYPEYKANRSLMLDDSHVRVQPLYEIIRYMRLAAVASGVEADDVIRHRWRGRGSGGIGYVISTGDKGSGAAGQRRVTLKNTMSARTLDEAGVKASSVSRRQIRRPGADRRSRGQRCRA